MNIIHIKAFLEVATTGSFQKAAENMHVTQSTMSARIKGLEQSINRQLFIRRRQGALLTPGGRNFLRYAVTVVKPGSVREWKLRCRIILSLLWV